MAFRLLTAATAQGTEVEATATEGSLAKHTFLADSLQPGKVYIITGSALVVDQNGTDEQVLRLRFGAHATLPASNTAIATTASIAVADGDVATFVCYMTVRSVGSAGVIAFHGSICQPDAEAVATTPMFGFHQVVTAMDTTAALYFDYSSDCDAAHADNEIAADSFVVIEAV